MNGKQRPALGNPDVEGQTLNLRSGWLGRFGLYVSVAAAAAVLLRFVRVDNEYLIVLAAFAPWIFVVAALITAAAHGFKPLATSIVVLALATGFLMPGSGLPRTDCDVTAGRSDDDIVIFSQNTLLGSPDPTVVAAQALAVGADVIALQESIPPFAEAVMEAAGPEFAHINTTSDFRAIISRYPLDDLDRRDLDGANFRGLVASTVAAPGGPILVASVHAPAPDIQGGRQRQLREFDAISGLADSGNVVAIGDFNAPPADQAYQSFLGDGGFIDAHSRAGCGFGVSWSPLPGFGPAVLSLDHAIVAGDLEVGAFEVLDYGGSDHKAIAVRVNG